jgi:glucose/arabinose dehydrogenase
MPEEALIVLTLNGDKVADEKRYDMGERIRDVIEAPDGSVLLLSDGDDAELLRLTPRGEARAG